MANAAGARRTTLCAALANGVSQFRANSTHAACRLRSFGLGTICVESKHIPMVLISSVAQDTGRIRVEFYQNAVWKSCSETIKCSTKQELLQSTCRSRMLHSLACRPQGARQWSVDRLHRNVVVTAGKTGSSIPAITFGSSIAPPQPSVHGMH